MLPLNSLFSSSLSSPYNLGSKMIWESPLCYITYPHPINYILQLSVTFLPHTLKFSGISPFRAHGTICSARSRPHARPKSYPLYYLSSSKTISSKSIFFCSICSAQAVLLGGSPYCSPLSHYSINTPDSTIRPCHGINQDHGSII